MEYPLARQHSRSTDRVNGELGSIGLSDCRIKANGRFPGSTLARRRIMRIRGRADCCIAMKGPMSCSPYRLFDYVIQAYAHHQDIDFKFVLSFVEFDSSNLGKAPLVTL